MSLRRLWRVARLDLALCPRRPIYWFWLALIVFISWGLSSGNVRIASGDSDVGGTEAWLTSQFAVGQILSMLILIFYAFFAAVIAGMLVIRDGELRVGELLHSTALRPAEYVWGRVLAALLSFIAVLALHLVAVIVIYHVLPRPAMDDMRGPLSLANYVRPAIIFGLPPLVFIAGTSFAIGTLTRKPILVFFFPVVLIVACGFFLWNWSPTWLDPGVDRVLMLIDPAGFRWLNETWLTVDRGVDFYNEAPIGLDAPFVVSRLAFIAIGLAAVAFTERRFAAGLRGAKHGIVAPSPGATTDATDGEASVPAASAPIAALRAASRPPGFFRGSLTVARFEFRELRHHPGLYLFAPLILVQVVGTAFFAVGAFGTPLLQTPGTLAVSSMNTLTLLLCLLIQFYTVESVQRDRNTGAAAMIYATPVPSMAILFGKALANTMIGAAIMLAALAGCGLVLLIQGSVGFSIRPFLITWGLVLLPTFLLWSAFVTAVAALVRSRYTTHGLCLAVLIVTGYKQLVGEMNWVGNWNAWGVIGWSDMGTLELNRFALTLNRLYALALAVLFIAVSIRVFARRDFDASRVMHRLRPRGLLVGGLRLLPFLVVPVTLGLVLWVGVVSGFQGERIEKENKDYWRKNIATWRDAPTPAISAVDLDVELDPAARWFRTAGTFTLSNPHETPLARIPLTGGTHWEDVTWTMNGEPYEPEDRSHLYIFTPATPLAPGKQIDVGFVFEGVYPKGITKNGGGASEFILPSGVVLTSFSPSFTPLVGYREEYGVDEDNKYESRDYPDDFFEGVTEPVFGSAWPFATRLRVTGPQDYTYNSVGRITSESVEAGRRTVVWESDHPVSFFNIVAGRWARHEGEHTTIFHHAAHAWNIDEMSEALDGARRHYGEWFHPYPWQELKLSEFPRLASYAQGFATNITFSESIGFLTKSDPRVNAAFMVTAHEAAHQWWGNILMPGKGPGGNILSEGMAHFSTILLTEEMRGVAARIQLCRRLEERYGDARVVDSERPLVKIDGSRSGDTTVTYDKGGWVAWMLLNLMGREVCLEGLQQFIAHYAADRDHPVLQDLVASLRPFAPDADAYDAFVDQWFFDVVMPEYVLSDAKSAPAGEGAGAGTETQRWLVTLTAENRGTGRMPIEVAATRGTRFDDDGAPVADYRDARTTVTLGAGERAEVTIPCEFEPDAVIVDPDARVLQLNREAAVAPL